MSFRGEGALEEIQNIFSRLDHFNSTLYWFPNPRFEYYHQFMRNNHLKLTEDELLSLQEAKAQVSFGKEMAKLLKTP